MPYPQVRKKKKTIAEIMAVTAGERRDVSVGALPTAMARVPEFERPPVPMAGGKKRDIEAFYPTPPPAQEPGMFGRAMGAITRPMDPTRQAGLVGMLGSLAQAFSANVPTSWQYQMGGMAKQAATSYMYQDFINRMGGMAQQPQRGMISQMFAPGPQEQMQAALMQQYLAGAERIREEPTLEEELTLRGTAEVETAKQLAEIGPPKTSFLNLGNKITMVDEVGTPIRSYDIAPPIDKIDIGGGLSSPQEKAIRGAVLSHYVDTISTRLGEDVRGAAKLKEFTEALKPFEGVVNYDKVAANMTPDEFAESTKLMVDVANLVRGGVDIFSAVDYLRSTGKLPPGRKPTFDISTGGRTEPGGGALAPAVPPGYTEVERGRLSENIPPDVAGVYFNASTNTYGYLLRDGTFRGVK